MPPGFSSDDTLPVPSVAILGADAMLAALPATAVQLAHACLAAGYAAAIPATWGDELVAERCLTHLAACGPEPAVMCSCPLVAERLLGSELTPLLVPLVAPPVACARYVRALYAPARVRLTYIGGCPSGADPALDAHLTPDELMTQLDSLGIVIGEQPLFFQSVLPPDRRRFYSMPGGVPAPERLAMLSTPRAFVELDADDCRTQLAEQLLSREHALIDLAPRLGCTCSGAIASMPRHEARAAVVALEPPRSKSEILDSHVHVDLDRPIPAASPSVSPVGSPSAGRERGATHERGSRGRGDATHARPVRDRSERGRRAGVALAFAAARQRRRRAALALRAAAPVPVARAVDGRVLPRAYLARRPSRSVHLTTLELEDTPTTDVSQWLSEPPAPRKRPSVAVPPQGAVADPLTH
ncbi:MAG TPA: hypothetical protein VFJ96_10325 [Gemmatimonadaceae bacterium]|nr:hypothetical protein [Gemmatimonadaceae bacterium]